MGFEVVVIPQPSNLTLLEAAPCCVPILLGCDNEVLISQVGCRGLTMIGCQGAGLGLVAKTL